MKFKTKIVLGLGTPLIMLLCVATLSYRSFVKEEQDRQWVSHTHEVMEKLGNLLSDLVSAETGERGFIIDGDERYLEDYTRGSSQLDRDLGSIRALTADNSHQQVALDRIEPLLRLRLEQFAERIRQRGLGIQRNGPVTLPKDGKPIMDRLRLEISTMKAEEQRLLELRVGAASASSRKTRFFIVSGNALAFSFLLLAGLVVRAEIEQRRKAEEEVRQLNASLEQRVEERTAELQAREQEFSRSNAELEQFAYVASHDLQEPLRMVASFTQLLARRYGDKLDRDAHDFIQYAVDGATRMQTLISDLLSYSRVGTQRAPFERTVCDSVLDQVLRSLKPAIAEHRAQITRDPMPVVMADRTQLAQLLQNLISNALKFHGGSPPKVHIGAVRNAQDWKFSVRDNGIGIPSDQGDRVFVIFQRLHTRAEYPGTGIGLAICKKIVAQHGGRIWFEPSPGGGTTFYFTLSAKDAVTPALGESDVHGNHARAN